MGQHSKIRRLSKELVVAYVHHVLFRVKQGDLAYLQLGIDANFQIYASLLDSVLASLLALDNKKVFPYSSFIIADCAQALRPILDKKEYSTILESRIISECVFDVCSLILETVGVEEQLVWSKG